MIKMVRGDILRADVEAIVNTVNCVGVMGRGIALQFKKAWPENFKHYALACKKKEVIPGKMFVFKTNQIANPKFIINFPTKRHWRGASLIEDIESGLNDLVRNINNLNIKSIAIPPLGAGLGGLEWSKVKNVIESHLENLDGIDIFVYEPAGAPKSKNIPKSKEFPKMTTGRAIMIGLIQRYLDGLLDPFVSLLEVHKLLYFMQEAGEPLNLKYEKAHYGPYARNLRHVLNSIEGYYISGYNDGSDNPDKQISIIPGAFEEAENFLNSHPETLKRFEKVSDLVQGFESPKGLEILSTVHWVNSKEKPKEEQETIKLVHSWNNRKKEITERQIIIANKILNEKEWN